MGSSQRHDSISRSCQRPWSKRRLELRRPGQKQGRLRQQPRKQRNRPKNWRIRSGRQRGGPIGLKRNGGWLTQEVKRLEGMKASIENTNRQIQEHLNKLEVDVARWEAEAPTQDGKLRRWIKVAEKEA